MEENHLVHLQIKFTFKSIWCGDDHSGAFRGDAGRGALCGVTIRPSTVHIASNGGAGAEEGLT